MINQFTLNIVKQINDARAKVNTAELIILYIKTKIFTGKTCAIVHCSMEE
jgi:hypothetical protein